MKKKFIKVMCLSMLVATLTPTASFAAEWKHDNVGWWYQNDDSSFAKSQWKQINGKWYYFNDVGYMITGRIQDSGNWYYLRSDGAMHTGWLQEGGAWFYFRSDGKMHTGWYLDGSTWYYFDSDGAMRTNNLAENSTTYTFNSSGACQNPYGDATAKSISSTWTPYSTSSLKTLAEAMLKGHVVYYNGQYWASPEYVTMLKNTEVVYSNDISSNTATVDRYSLATQSITFDENDNNYDLDGVN